MIGIQGIKGDDRDTGNKRGEDRDTGNERKIYIGR
jgi:hypothetical protein